MPRALWKGSLTFGLVSIPVKLYSATRERGISFTMLHRECHTPLRYKRWCSTCNREVEWNEIDKGYELSKGRYVPISPKELEGLQLRTVRSIDVERFVSVDQVDSIYFGSHYYLAPGEGGEKAYALLQRVLSLTNKAAVGKLVFHNKEHVVLIRPYRRGLLLTTLRYPNEVAPIERLEELEELERIELRGPELELARALIERMVGEFKPDEYRDRYREAVMELVKQKAEGIAAPAVKPIEAPAPVDLMKALEESLKAMRKEKPAVT